MNLKTLDSVPSSHLVIKYQEQTETKQESVSSLSVDQIVRAFSSNRIIPLQGNFGGFCQNGTLAGNLVLALYVQSTKGLPSGWDDMELEHKAFNFVKELHPHIKYTLIGWNNMFPVKQMSQDEQKAYNLGQEAWKVLKKV